MIYSVTGSLWIRIDLVGGEIGALKLQEPALIPSRPGFFHELSQTKCIFAPEIVRWINVHHGGDRIGGILRGVFNVRHARRVAALHVRLVHQRLGKAGLCPTDLGAVESYQNRHPEAPHLAIVAPAATVLAVGLHTDIDPPLDNVGKPFQSLALVNCPRRRARNRFIRLARSGWVPQIHPDDLVLGKCLGVLLEETACRSEELAFPLGDTPDAPGLQSVPDYHPASIQPRQRIKHRTFRNFEIDVLISSLPTEIVQPFLAQPALDLGDEYSKVLPERCVEPRFSAEFFQID